MDPFLSFGIKIICIICSKKKFFQVGRVLLCFASAFRNVPKAGEKNGENYSPNQKLDVNSNELYFQFDLFVEMKEEDGRGSFTICPQEKNCFKLRRGREKRIIIMLQQVNGPKILAVQKCFGLLLGAGRYVRHSDMHLLDMVSGGG